MLLGTAVHLRSSISVRAFLCYLLFVCFWRNSPQWARASSFTRFLDHTRHTTVGRTPLDEWSARRRDLYLITRNTHNRHPCPRWRSNPPSQQASGRRPTPQTARPLGPAVLSFCDVNFRFIPLLCSGLNRLHRNGNKTDLAVEFY